MIDLTNECSSIRQATHGVGTPPASRTAPQAEGT